MGIHLSIFISFTNLYKKKDNSVTCEVSDGIMHSYTLLINVGQKCDAQVCFMAKSKKHFIKESCYCRIITPTHNAIYTS